MEHRAVRERSLASFWCALAAKAASTAFSTWPTIRLPASINAVQSAGVPLGVAKKGIVVVGSNCMKDGIIHIRSGEQYGTATQIPTEEATFAAKKVIAYFNGGAAEEIRNHSGLRHH